MMTKRQLLALGAVSSLLLVGGMYYGVSCSEKAVLGKEISQPVIRLNQSREQLAIIGITEHGGHLTQTEESMPSESATSEETDISETTEEKPSESSSSSETGTNELTDSSPKPPSVTPPPTVLPPKEPEGNQSVKPPMKEEQEASQPYQLTITKTKVTGEFVSEIGPDAQQVAWDAGLYASVMIAQAILETGSGNSQLSQPPNHNLFGIKGSFEGKSVVFHTQEDNGSGKMYTIKSAFRKYPSYVESMTDYADLLKRGIGGQPAFYYKLWKKNTTSYKEATAYLTGRYATDTHYDAKLNALIETYQLTDYDQKPGTPINRDERTERQPISRQRSEENTSQSAQSAPNMRLLGRVKAEFSDHESELEPASSSEEPTPVPDLKTNRIFGQNKVQ